MLCTGDHCDHGPGWMESALVVCMRCPGHVLLQRPIIGRPSDKNPESLKNLYPADPSSENRFPARSLLDLRELLPEDLVPELPSSHEIAAWVGGMGCRTQVKSLH